MLLLDEPFGALDAAVRRDLRRWLRELHDRTGLTTVMVTHDQAEALEVADRVAILRGGRVEQVDTPAGLWAAPASAFVFRFIGDAVELPCTVRGGVARFGIAGLPDLPCGLAGRRGAGHAAAARNRAGGGGRGGGGRGCVAWWRPGRRCGWRCWPAGSRHRGAAAARRGAARGRQRLPA